MTRKELVFSWLAAGAVAFVASCADGTAKAAPKAEPKPAPKSAAAQPPKPAPAAAPAPIPTPAAVTDSVLEEKVQKAIQADSTLSLQAKSVVVSVQDGTVTLRGTVSDELEKTNLGALASNILGVRGVDNQLEVKSG